VVLDRDVDPDPSRGLGDVLRDGDVPEDVVVDELARAELRAAVAGALASLPPRRGELLHALFADDGRSYARIAHDVGIPVSSIGPIRARVLAQLRRRLDLAR
jgi:DNA-directed RNA polymerase specialized sigma24 family protein